MYWYLDSYPLCRNDTNTNIGISMKILKKLINNPVSVSVWIFSHVLVSVSIWFLLHISVWVCLCVWIITLVSSLVWTLKGELVSVKWYCYNLLDVVWEVSGKCFGVSRRLLEDIWKLSDECALGTKGMVVQYKKRCLGRVNISFTVGPNLRSKNPL